MEKQSPRYARPDISLIEESVTPYGVSLYVAGSKGASNLDLLHRHNITTVINCAVNLDFNFVSVDDDVSSGDTHVVPHGVGAVRYYKLGMVDGHGNPETLMLAGYYLMRSALLQEWPEKPSYPRRERGNVLVNCRGGRSRSVALTGLFLHHAMPERYPTLDAALDHVRKRRELRPDEWFEAPKPVLVQAARTASDWIRVIGHDQPTRKSEASPDAGSGSAAKAEG